MSCGTQKIVDNDKESQGLSGWPNFDFDTLATKLEGHCDDEVYVYIVASTKRENKDGVNFIRQMGSGPNLEGDIATLCTCKHAMRKSRTTDEWKGVWIAGLTSRAKAKNFNRHYLLYMMKIQRGFDSHKALYKHMKRTNNGALETKNSRYNRLGDIFQPRNTCITEIDKWNHEKYYDPCQSHSHSGVDWHSDVEKYDGNEVPLLPGEKGATYEWH